jgi:hypothetical protein
MRGWRAAPVAVTQLVWGPHPVQISQPIDALYGLDLGGADPMHRREDQSAYNGTRYNGDLGPIQHFGRTYSLPLEMARVGAGSLPSAQGSAASSTPMLDLLGATVG